MKTQPKFLVVDLFCGAGGTTIGFDQSNVAKVIAAVNHNPKAIKSHWVNHPEVQHYEEDIRTLDLTDLVALVQLQREAHPDAMLILWASLECTNFSKAKGGQPRDADSRTLAEHLHRYITAIDPDYVQIENVVEFMSWGPLDANGKPVSAKAGCDWVRWCGDVRQHGYYDAWQQMNAADYGARTSRNRLFGCFAKHGVPIYWPEATHAKNPQRAGLPRNLAKWQACKPCLDLTDIGTSIFTPGKLKSDKTFQRIYAGLVKYVAGMSMKEFIVKYLGNNAVSGINSGTSTDEPLPVITTQNRLYLAQIVLLNSYYGNTNTLQTADSASPTLTTKDRLGVVQFNWLDKQYSGPTNHQDLERPIGTIMSVDKHALITSESKHYLYNPQHGAHHHGLDTPCPTIIARQDKAPLYVMEAAGGESPAVLDSDSDTIKAIKSFMVMYGIADIKMRMLRVKELKQIQGFPEAYELCGNQADQKKFIGNSVCPVVVEKWALAMAAPLEELQKVA